MYVCVCACILPSYIYIHIYIYTYIYNYRYIYIYVFIYVLKTLYEHVKQWRSSGHPLFRAPLCGRTQMAAYSDHARGVRSTPNRPGSRSRPGSGSRVCRARDMQHTVIYSHTFTDNYMWSNTYLNTYICIYRRNGSYVHL